MSLLDTDDNPSIINAVNLLEKGWTYAPTDEHWIKTTSIHIGVKHPHFIYKDGKVWLRGWFTWGDLSNYVDTMEELEDWVYRRHKELTHTNIFGGDDIFSNIF
jgi:hypothetical protein